MPVALEYRSDHLLLRMVGPAALSSLRRAVVVPYSDLVEAVVEPPRWPAPLVPRVGTHVPGLAVSGSFWNWQLKDRRFLHFDRKTQRVLTLRLKGHPLFDEVSVEVRDADAAKRELDARRGES